MQFSKQQDSRYILITKMARGEGGFPIHVKAVPYRDTTLVVLPPSPSPMPYPLPITCSLATDYSTSFVPVVYHARGRAAQQLLIVYSRGHHAMYLATIRVLVPGIRVSGFLLANALQQQYCGVLSFTSKEYDNARNVYSSLDLESQEQNSQDRFGST